MAIAVRDGQRLKRAVVATSAEQAELRELRVTRRRRQSQIAFGSVDFPQQGRAPGQASAIVERGDRAALDYAGHTNTAFARPFGHLDRPGKPIAERPLAIDKLSGGYRGGHQLEMMCTLTVMTTRSTFGLETSS